MAHALIVTEADLPNYGNVDFLSQFEGTDVIATNLQAATDIMIGLVKPVVVPPISAPFPADLKLHTAAIAIYFLKSVSGMAPMSAAVGDENIVHRYEKALLWGKGIGLGTDTCTGIVDASSNSGGAQLLNPVGDRRRGW